MKPTTFILGLTAATILAAGCANFGSRPVPTLPTTKPSAAPLIVPAGPDPGKITQVNARHRFVVVDFGRRILPPPGSRLIAYRHDQPVATFRLTESTRGRFAIADILDGDPRVGDEIQTP